MKGLWSDGTILLNACLRDLRYDRQCEEARGPWLWQVMNAVGVTDAFRGAILDSLTAIDDGLAGHQLCQFAVFYARNGDERFRLRLQEIVTRKPDPSYPSCGEHELIDLDGEAGFLCAARARAGLLMSKEWDLEDGFFIEAAIKQLGEPVVLTTLHRESPSSSGIKRLYDGWQRSAENKANEKRQSHGDRMRQISLDTVIRAAECEESPPAFLRGWGRYADEGDVRAILSRLLNAQRPAVVANYLRVFSSRPVPDFNEHFLAFAFSEDENVCTRAYAALAQNKHPAIRKFALDNLNERITEPNFLELFIRNFRPGDEGLLLASFRVPEDVVQSHWWLMDLLQILEHNRESKCHELAKRIYRLTPCSSCRHDATKLLISRNVAPRWLIEECRHDAVEDTRKLADATVCK